MRQSVQFLLAALWRYVAGRLRVGSMLGWLLIPIALSVVAPSWAAAPAAEQRAQPLHDPELERRALALGHRLRCVVCQNQSIAESNAELAHDLMNQVRAMLQAGKSEQEIVDFLVARYGEFVLFEPPFDARTLLLWVGPFALAALGLFGLWSGLRRRQQQSGVGATLDEAAKAQADALLAGDSPSKTETRVAKESS